MLGTKQEMMKKMKKDYSAEFKQEAVRLIADEDIKIVVAGAHSTNWFIPDNHYLPEPHEVHVWKIGLLTSPVQLDQLETLLSDDEPARAGWFSFDRHRRWFITGRAVMRILLGRYTSRLPEALESSYIIGCRGEWLGNQEL